MRDIENIYLFTKFELSVAFHAAVEIHLSPVNLVTNHYPLMPRFIRQLLVRVRAVQVLTVSEE